MGPLESFGTDQLFELLAPVAVGIVLGIVGIILFKLISSFSLK